MFKHSVKPARETVEFHAGYTRFKDHEMVFGLQLGTIGARAVRWRSKDSPQNAIYFRDPTGLPFRPNYDHWVVLLSLRDELIAAIVHNPAGWQQLIERYDLLTDEDGLVIDRRVQLSIVHYYQYIWMDERFGPDKLREADNVTWPSVAD